MERRHLIVSGRVQGVGFRWSCWREARALGLTGWVRNCADGCVEVVAEGPPSRLDALRDWCRRGPPHARVERLDASCGPAQGAFASFDIREDAPDSPL